MPLARLCPGLQREGHQLQLTSYTLSPLTEPAYTLNPLSDNSGIRVSTLSSYVQFLPRLIRLCCYPL